MAGLCLVLNLGSSSLKAALIDPQGACHWRGQRSLTPGTGPGSALQDWLEPAIAAERGAITRIGHRVVHGGELFTAPTRITPAVEARLRQLVPLAPLHNPPALEGIAWANAWAPACPQWVCFDTAFHSNLPEAARTYALPEHLRQQGYRRYGFHGLNHQHVSTTVQRQWAASGKDPEALRLISAHLGAGASLAAVRGGRCIDTTMGYTPLEGLVMASRSGSVDPGVLLALMRDGISHGALSELLEQHSGLKGLSGLSGDMRELRQAAKDGHTGAQLALAVFRHRLLQLIGSMAASLGGVDLLALSGGIGEHDAELKDELQAALQWIPGLEITVVPADEEGMIARLVAAQPLSCGREDRGSDAAGGSGAGDRH